MAGLLQRLYSKVYINVIVENHYADISVHIEKMGRTIKDKKRRFEINEGKLTQEITHYIEKNERKSPFSYISVLNPAAEQGARKGCSSEGMKDKIWLCVGKKRNPWSIYVDTSFLQSVQKQFSVTGVDFIFSPFSMMASRCKEIKTDKAQMFVMVLEQSMSIAVFKNGYLEFARHHSLEEKHGEFDMDDDADLMLDDDLSLDEADDSSMDLDLEINIDEAEAEGVDSLEELDDLEGLDDLDGLDELDELDELDGLGEDEPLESFTEMEEEEQPQQLLDEADVDEDSSSSLSGFSRNFKRFELIQNTIHEFYHAGDIESSFIEDIFIVDPNDDAKDLQGYLEDELFVTVHYRDIDIHEALLSLARDEVKDAS